MSKKKEDETPDLVIDILQMEIDQNLPNWLAVPEEEKKKIRAWLKARHKKKEKKKKHG